MHEEGTHNELMSKKGIYYSLVMRQLEQEKEEKIDLVSQHFFQSLKTNSLYLLRNVYVDQNNSIEKVCVNGEACLVLW